MAISILRAIIFLAGLYTPFGLGAPYYAFFWALACWVIAGAIQSIAKEEKKVKKESNHAFSIELKSKEFLRNVMISDRTGETIL